MPSKILLVAATLLASAMATNQIHRNVRQTNLDAKADGSAEGSADGSGVTTTEAPFVIIGAEGKQTETNVAVVNQILPEAKFPDVDQDTEVQVAQIVGEIADMSCATGSLAENLAALSKAGYDSTIKNGAKSEDILSVTTTPTCEVPVARHRRADDVFTFATEIIFAPEVKAAIVEALVVAATENKIDYSTAVLVDQKGDVTTLTVKTTSGESVTVTVATLEDPDTDLTNLIQPKEATASKKGKKDKKGKDGKGYKAKKAKGIKAPKGAKEAKCKCKSLKAASADVGTTEAAATFAAKSSATFAAKSSALTTDATADKEGKVEATTFAAKSSATFAAKSTADKEGKVAATFAAKAARRDAPTFAAKSSSVTTEAPADKEGKVEATTFAAKSSATFAAKSTADKEGKVAATFAAKSSATFAAKSTADKEGKLAATFAAKSSPTKAPKEATEADEADCECEEVEAKEAKDGKSAKKGPKKAKLGASNGKTAAVATGVPLLLIGVGLALMAVARKRSSYSTIEDNEVAEVVTEKTSLVGPNDGITIC